MQSLADSGFHRQGRDVNLKGGANVFVGQFFLKSAWKWNNRPSRVMGCPLRPPPLNSPMATLEIAFFCLLWKNFRFKKWRNMTKTVTALIRCCNNYCLSALLTECLQVKCCLRDCSLRKKSLQTPHWNSCGTWEKCCFFICAHWLKWNQFNTVYTNDISFKWFVELSKWMIALMSIRGNS